MKPASEARQAASETFSVSAAPENILDGLIGPLIASEV